MGSQVQGVTTLDPVASTGRYHPTEPFEVREAAMARTPKDVRKLAQEAGAQIVDLRFVDLPGIWQHFSLPAKDFSDDLFDEGIGFDGSSIRGFQQIQESDMLLICDPDTAYMDPVLEIPTLSLICNVFDPVTREPYTRDPRHIAQKAEPT